MSDRPSPVNGKRNQDWGTLGACPACGQCLCFGCHPAGPCVDDAARPGSSGAAGVSVGFTSTPSTGVLDASWLAPDPFGPGARIRAAPRRSPAPQAPA